MSVPVFTVGELRRKLVGLNDNDILSFPGGLEFYRIKKVDDNEFFFEFNEPEGYLTDEFKLRNPHVKVVFINPEFAEGDEGSPVATLEVAVF